MKLLKRIFTKPAYWLAKRSSLFDGTFRAFKAKRQSMRLKIARKSFACNQNVVLFSSFMGRSFSDSPKALFKELIADPVFNDWEFIWAFRGRKYLEFTRLKGILNELGNLDSEVAQGSDIVSNFLNKMTIVRYGSDNYYASLARSKFWVSNSRLPDGIRPSEHQIYVQTWHGTPLKRLGADISSTRTHPTKKRSALIEWYMLEASKWDFLLTQGPHASARMTSAFSLNKLEKQPVFIEEGLPRNTALFRLDEADLGSLRESLGLPLGKKVILYAPTYRDNQHDNAKGYVYNLALDLEKLEAQLSDEWVILFRTHYFVNSSYDLAEFKGFIWDVSKYEDITDLYAISDVLVTDYSSALYDFVHLDRPIILYAYDLDHYEDKLRGFYQPITDIPGEVVLNQEGLVDSIRDIESQEERYSAKRKKFIEDFGLRDSENTTKAVIRRVFKDS